MSVPTKFKGNLFELLEICKNYLPTKEKLVASSNWIGGQWGNDVILPIRKFNHHPNRGQIFSFGGKEFIPVDNEPLISIYKILSEENQDIDGDFLTLFNSRRLRISWKLEVQGERLRNVAKGGVVAKFRNEGLKLAHILDAAKGIGYNDIADFKLRFLRAMNPVNCFPFPSSRRFDFQAYDGMSDPAEHPRIQMIMAAFMMEYVGHEEFRLVWDNLGGEVAPLINWQEEAKKIIIEYAIKDKNIANSNKTFRKIHSNPTTLVCSPEERSGIGRPLNLQDFKNSENKGIALIYRNSKGIYDNDDFLMWQPSVQAWGLARNTKLSMELEGIRRKLFLMDLDGLCQGIYFCENPEDYRTPVSVFQVHSFIKQANLRVAGSSFGRHLTSQELCHLIMDEL